jgi:hypothetical protein
MGGDTPHVPPGAKRRSGGFLEAAYGARRELRRAEWQRAGERSRA